VHGSEQWYELRLDLLPPPRVQYQVDAFCVVGSSGRTRPFTGNPAAAVLTVDGEVDDVWMQNLAMENNLAETAFVSHLGGNRFTLRWMTPTVEVALCGHATLGAAHAVYHDYKLVPLTSPIEFHTRQSGILTCSIDDEGLVVLNFPATPPIRVDLTPDELGHIKSGFGINAGDIIFAGRSLYDLVIQVTPEIFQNNLTINQQSIEALGGRGCIVCCLGGKRTTTSLSSSSSGGSDAEEGQIIYDKRYDFLSRFFAPCAGVPEDHVTGSAHCALAPLFFDQIPGESSLLGYQNSRRGGVLKCSYASDAKDRILLAGRGVTVMTSTLHC
jgi:PhzF family phenazine biosynthesis protein